MRKFKFLHRAGLCAVAAIMTSVIPAYAADLTYSRDIAPILQEKCQTCHNPEGIGPMPLMNFQQVKPFAGLIKDRTVSRVMPPWHTDSGIGIQKFKNDASLSDEQISTIAAWVDAGAPEGNSADLPAAIKFPSGAEWQLKAQMGEPDLIVSSAPFDVPAGGQDQWWGPTAKFAGMPKDRYLRAAEFKAAYPLGKKVVHHGHVTLSTESGRRGGVPLARYGVGKSWEIFSEGTGLLIPSEGTLEWNLHYAPISTAVPADVVDVGLWFYPEGYQPDLITEGEVLFKVDGTNGRARGQDILVPPNSMQVLEGIHYLDKAATIHSFRPHLHMRGKVMSMEAIYPDGTREMFSQVNKYDHNWQIAYIYEDEVKPLLPAGTILKFTSVFDNTAENPINPDPNQWVLFGRRGVDEMSHAWVGITYMNDEQYETAVAARRAAQATLTLLDD
jgi:hypothetical protein